MPIPRIEHLKQVPCRKRSASRLWGEWCFVKVCAKHIWRRLLLMLAILLVGAFCFHTLEPAVDGERSFLRSFFQTFALAFGEPPAEFPTSGIDRALCFIIPILGLTIIVEGIIDFSLILRDRRRFERSWCTMLAASYKDHIIIIGLGRLGYRVFMTLRRLGHPVIVITQPGEEQFVEEVRRSGSPIILGDARQEALLEEANVAAARSIVVATSDDLTNLECALDARRINPAIRVVLRMFDQNMADKVGEGFNIRMAMSQSAISAPTFATCAVAPATVNSFVLGDQLVAMQRWLVRGGGPFDGLSVADVLGRHRVTIVELTRADQASQICPGPEVVLTPGDGLMIQGPVTILEKLRDHTAADIEAIVGA